MKITLIGVLLFVLFHFEGRSQNSIPVGTWRTHYSYNNTTSLATSGEYIYAGSEESFFRFDLSENEVQKLTKEQGVIGVGINTLGYHEGLSTLFVGYDDGNIDYIRNDKQVGNLPDIVNSQSILGSKSINDQFFYEKFAFLSCDFGVVKLDLESMDIPEDYRNLGVSQGSNPVYSTAIFSQMDSIFIATELGLMVAEFRPEVNLQDASNWVFFVDSTGPAIDSIFHLEYFNEGIYAGRNGLGRSYLLKYTGKWEQVKEYIGQSIKELKKQGSQLNVVRGNVIEIWEGDNLIRTVSDQEIVNPQSYSMDRNGKDWVGSFQRGLLSNVQGGFIRYSPDGPFSNLAQEAKFINDRMVITGGFYNPDNAKQGSRNSGFFEFLNGEWINYNSLNDPNSEQIPFTVKDIVASTYDRVSGNKYYSSNGYGLICRDINDNWTLFDETNSTLRNQDPSNNFRAVRVVDAEVDDDGIVWVSNTLIGTNFHKYDLETGWQAFSLNGDPATIVIDNVGTKWIRGLPNRSQGIIVFNENEPIQQKKLGTSSGSGNLPNNRVNAIEKDLQGDIWVGTDDGVAVFFSPENIFSTNPSDAVTPIFEQRPLLRFEKVTCITVDGGNRKWIGTENGVWLFTPDGSEVIENFRENNSPLPSDKIINVGIHPNTGEVFFVTEKGVVSYRGTATEGGEVNSGVEVFPNPVPPGYQGFITISGLASNSNVKITDINGRLFYEMTAEGGTAAWNGMDYNGNRPKSGVYMVFSSDDEGNETYVAKIAYLE